MRKYFFLWLVTIASLCFSLPSSDFMKEKIVVNTGNIVNQVTSILETKYFQNTNKPVSLSEIKKMLQGEAITLNPVVVDKVLTSLFCAQRYNVAYNNVLTVIDYSLPSNQKRLWVFDLREKRLLFHTYVSHGIKTGTLFSTFFSNKNNSRASSIGIYTTGQAYFGREGLSLKLDGLDRGFNDNASNRAVVMHAGWYIDEGFIKKYGRAGRSWGCPGLPSAYATPIIHTIKEGSLFVIYYPSDDWFLTSKFLNCHIPPHANLAKITSPIASEEVREETREEVLFANAHLKNKHAETDPIVAMSADNYMQIFHTKIPLERMLRRQLNHQVEYIALSNSEFKHMVTNHNINGLNSVCFIIPLIKMVHGYYATEMEILNLGKIKDVKINLNLASNADQVINYTVYFEGKPPVNLRTTNRFIRWVGL